MHTSFARIVKPYNCIYQKYKMHRSLKNIPNETWYYYTIYNSYDDEREEYRCERNTKLVERIQSKPPSNQKQYQQSKHDSSSINYETLIRNSSTDLTKIVTATNVRVETDSVTQPYKNDHSVDTKQYLPENKRSSHVSRLLLRVASITKEILQKLSCNCNLFRHIVKYFSCWYENILNVLISPSVATGMLLSNLMLLILILWIDDKKQWKN
jgi:hypothetical protein